RGSAEPLRDGYRRGPDQSGAGAAAATRGSAGDERRVTSPARSPRRTVEILQPGFLTKEVRGGAGLLILVPKWSGVLGGGGGPRASRLGARRPTADDSERDDERRRRSADDHGPRIRACTPGDNRRSAGADPGRRERHAAHGGDARCPLDDAGHVPADGG